MPRKVRFSLPNASSSKTTSTTSMGMPQIKNSIIPSKVTNQFLQHILKATLLELKILKENSSQFDELLKNNKDLDSTLNKFLSNQNLDLNQSKELGKNLLKFIQDSKRDSTEFNSVLNKLDLHILNLINQEADREQNQEKLLNTLSNIDKEIEVSLRRDEKIYDLLRSLKTGINTNTITNEKKSGFGILDFVKNLPNLKNLPSTIASALGLGSGGLLATLLGAKGLGKFFGKNKVSSNKVRTTKKGRSIKKPINSPSVLTKVKTKAKNFVDSTKSKISNAGKSLGSKLTTAKTTLKTGATALLKKGGKFIPVVGTALAVGFTLKDLYDNAKEEFFGKDSQTKDMSTKIRNVITKTFANFVSDLSFGLINSETIKSAIESFGNNLGDIANWIYEKASQFMDLPKKVFNKGKQIAENTYNAGKEAAQNFGNTVVEYTPDKVKDWFDWMAGNKSGNQTNATPKGILTQEALNLAKNAQTNIVANKYTGGKALSVQQITRGAGACYANVWKDIKKTGLDKKGISPTGNQMSAYNFAEWANTPVGMSKLDRVQVGSKIVNGFVEGMLPGDIVVYGKNYEKGHKHGHIEIVGTDGNLYSDFKNKPDFALKYLQQGRAIVYRLKTNSKKQSSLAKNTGEQKVLIKKPLVNLQPQNTTSQNTVKPKIGDSKGFKQVMFSALEKNESKDATKLVKDPNVGYNFGKSQFNSVSNPEAWKKIGFSKQEIDQINSGKFDKNSVQQKLLSKSKEIANLDMANKEDLYNRTLEQKKTLFESQGYSIKDPKVFGQLYDINNQYGKYLLDKDSAKWMAYYSGSNEINLKGIMGWRKNRGQEGKIRPLDQERRFNNINDTFNSYSIPEIQKLKLEQNTKKQASNVTPNQVAMNPVNNNVSIMRSNDNDMLILNSGLIG